VRDIGFAARVPKTPSLAHILANYAGPRAFADLDDMADAILTTSA